jgi:hypothetical protein
MGTTMLKEFLRIEKESGREYKVEILTLFNIKNKQLDKELGIDLKDLDNYAYIWLPETNELIRTDVIKIHL